MKTIGLIGGMSWESTLTYYKVINEEVSARLGALHSAKILLYSVDFDEIEACQSSGDWDRSAAILSAAAKSLEAGGADFILICTNTMHKVADTISKAVTIPIIHIADATAQALTQANITKTALLGTKYTMKQDFYKERIENAGIGVLIPEENDIELVNNTIYNELCRGIISEDSRRQFSRIIDALKAKGAQAVILGCTEIGLLVRPADSTLPVFDTTLIHAASAVSNALKNDR